MEKIGKYIATGDTELDKIIANQTRKLVKIAAKNTMDLEDLRQDALVILFDFLAKEGVDDVSELDLHQKMRYKMVLNRRLTEIANQSQVIKKDGKRYYLQLYKTIQSIDNVNEVDIVGLVQNIEDGNSNHFARWFWDNKHRLLTKKQLKLIDDCLVYNMVVKDIAASNGVTASAINQTIRRLADRVLDIYTKEYELDVCADTITKIDELYNCISKCKNIECIIDYVDDYILENIEADHMQQILYGEQYMDLCNFSGFEYEDEVEEFLTNLRKYYNKACVSYQQLDSKINRKKIDVVKIEGSSTTVFVNTYGHMIGLDRLD